jgi:hypothetical protein
MFGQGQSFVPKRPLAHRRIRDFYTRRLAEEATLPVVIETTGIGDTDSGLQSASPGRKRYQT